MQAVSKSFFKFEKIVIKLEIELPFNNEVRQLKNFDWIKTNQSFDL